MAALGKRVSICCGFVVGAVLCGMGAVASAEDPPGPLVSIQPRAPKSAGTEEVEAPTPNIRSENNLVQINVTVTTPLGQVVTAMEKENFRLFEDKVEQKIVSFTSEDSPITVALVFDVSGSMGAKLAKSRQAATQFFRTANPDDEFFLVQFSDAPEVAVPLTHDTEDIQTRLAFTNAKGRTALLDGVYLALHEIKKGKNPRRAVLILSDGGDNSSRYTESEIRNLVKESDVQIYAIGIFEPIGGRGRTAEELAGPGLLSDLAEQTGGRHFPVENLNDLPDIAAKIGVELRSQYMLGFNSTNTNKDGKYRRVEVKLNQPRGLPPLKAYYRTGYYAPTQ